MCLLFPALTLVFFNLQYCNIDFEAQCVKFEALTWPVSLGVCVSVCVFVLSLGGAGIGLRRRHTTFVEPPSEASSRPALA